MCTKSQERKSRRSEQVRKLLADVERVAASDPMFALVVGSIVVLATYADELEERVEKLEARCADTERKLAGLVRFAKTQYSIDDSGARALATAAKTYGASAAEAAAIKRLHDGIAERVDIERLAPLAKLAGLPWEDLFPEIL